MKKNELIATRKAVNQLYFETDITKKDLAEAFEDDVEKVVFEIEMGYPPLSSNL